MLPWVAQGRARTLGQAGPWHGIGGAGGARDGNFPLRRSGGSGQAAALASGYVSGLHLMGFAAALDSGTREKRDSKDSSLKIPQMGFHF